jgi:hypothetical protein
MPPAPRLQDGHCATPGEFLSFVAAYCELLAARWEAEDLQRPASLAAVPYARLRARSVSDANLLWMMYHAHVEHLLPARSKARGGAALRPAATLHFGRSSSFSLTDPGAEFADEFLADVLAPGEEGAFARAWERLLLGTLAPSYDRGDRLFSWGRHVLKCFRQPAGNQELVLSAAEEQAWPRWFDDPLPRREATNPKLLLRNTIKDLNRGQSVSLIHFIGDGTGTRVGWEHR